MKINGLLRATILNVCLVATASAASFPCEKAKTRIEKLVCGNEEVSQLDEYLGRYFAATKTHFRDAASCVTGDQRQWLRRTREPCKNTTCLKKAYLERLAELHDIQPGVTRLRNLQLPSVPALKVIVPALQDPEAGPPPPDATPLIVRGTLINEINDGGDIILKTAEGKKYPLLLLMDANGDALEQLSLLAKENSGQYLARGFAPPKSSDPSSFEPRRCVFVYRLPDRD